MVSKGLTGAVIPGLHAEPSYPAHAGYPVRRGVSILPRRLWNTGSPAFAGDDDRGVGARKGRKAFEHPPLVIPRACGVTSTPRPLGLTALSLEYWVARSSRAMTTGGNGASFQTAALFARHTAAFSRHDASEFCETIAPSGKQRARGMPGAQCTRSLVCAGVVEYAHEYSQRRHRKHPAFPTQWFYGLYVISPGTGLSCPRHLSGNCFPRKLSASVGAPGPHDFAVRLARRSSCVAKASTASHPAFVTTRTPLLSRRDGAENTHFPIFRKRNFCGWRADNPNQLESAREIRFYAHAIFGRERHFTRSDIAQNSTESPRRANHLAAITWHL
jgi:hypothetical protein